MKGPHVFRGIQRFVVLTLAFSLNCGISNAGSCPKRVRTESLRKRQGFQWQTDSSPSFHYFFEPSSPAARSIGAIKERSEKARVHNLQLLGVTSVPFPVDIYLVESSSRMKELCGYDFSWACGTTIGVLHGGGISAVGGHEDCHVVASRVWGENREKWLQEGLAVYADDHWSGHPLHALCKHLASAGKLVPIRSFMDNGWPRRYSGRISYPELGSFVKFLYESYGMNAVKAAWQRGAMQVPSIFGKSLDRLESEWLSTIRESDASAVQYQPD